MQTTDTAATVAQTASPYLTYVVPGALIFTAIITLVFCWQLHRQRRQLHDLTGRLDHEALLENAEPTIARVLGELAAAEEMASVSIDKGLEHWANILKRHYPEMSDLPDDPTGPNFLTAIVRPMLRLHADGVVKSAWRWASKNTVHYWMVVSSDITFDQYVHVEHIISRLPRYTTDRHFHFYLLNLRYADDMPLTDILPEGAQRIPLVPAVIPKPTV